MSTSVLAPLRSFSSFLSFFPYSVKSVRKKGQLHMTETLVVLLVFFMIAGIVLIAVVSFQTGSQDTNEAERASQLALAVAQDVMSMPELVASRQGVEGVNTLDEFKVKAFASLMNESDELALGMYQERFGSSTITLRYVFSPELARGDIEQDLVLYDYEPSTYSGAYPFFMPVTVYNPSGLALGRGPSYAVAILEVVYYS